MNSTNNSHPFFLRRSRSRKLPVVFAVLGGLAEGEDQYINGRRRKIAGSKYPMVQIDFTDKQELVTQFDSINSYVDEEGKKLRGFWAELLVDDQPVSIRKLIFFKEDILHEKEQYCRMYDYTSERVQARIWVEDGERGVARLTGDNQFVTDSKVYQNLAELPI